MLQQSLTDKLCNKSALIGIIGIGYVGLPLLMRFAEQGFHVLGIDVDKNKIDQLNGGQSYIEHIPSTSIQSNQNFIQATHEFSSAKEADVLLLCVPTPLTKCREPDLSYVTQTLDSLIPHIREGQVICLESTSYPGTTEEVIRPRLEAAGFTIGKDLFLVYSPEREDPGNPDFNTADIPKVCSGSTPACLEVSIALYGSIINKVVPVSSTQTAEMTKLLENIHRAVNIGLVNEMKIVADKMGIDIHEVIHAASTKPFGFVPYFPGPGIGGHCIPVDPFYLTWKAREYGLHTRFIELAGEVNSNMPKWVFIKVAEALNARQLPVNGCNVLILGIAYKNNVGDCRESPSLKIMKLLSNKGATIAYSDPHVSHLVPNRDYDFDLKSIELTPESIKQFDCVVLATAHTKFDYDLIKQHAKLIVDTRGVYLEPADHIVNA